MSVQQPEASVHPQHLSEADEALEADLESITKISPAPNDAGEKSDVPPGSSPSSQAGAHFTQESFDQAVPGPLFSREHGEVAGSYSTTTTEPATPTSVFSEQSDPPHPLSDSGSTLPFSPTALASSGKRFWNESSSWFISRILYNTHSQSSSSGNSSIDKSSPAYLGKCKLTEFPFFLFL